MECMKCGQKTDPGQVFCERCLAQMEQYPVKPDTVIQLPQQPKADTPKKAPLWRPPLSDQERLKRLRLRNRILSWCLVIAVFFCCLLSYAVGILYQQLEEIQTRGKNYSTVETIDSSSLPSGRR